MRAVRRLSVLVVAITLGALCTSGVADARTGYVRPAIFGGERAPASPAVVFVGISDAGCTATQLNESWVLLAAHCIPESTETLPLSMYQTNSMIFKGPAHPIAEYLRAPSGDVGLVRLATPVPNTDYVTLDLTYQARSAGTGIIAGFGIRDDRASAADALYQANQNLAGPYGDAYGGPAQKVAGINGAGTLGDSGGPLFVDGKVVAVASHGENPLPRAVTDWTAYALLSQVGDWISATAGPRGIPVPAAPRPVSPFGS